MSKTATLQIKIDPVTKTKANSILKKLGLNMSDAVNVFLQQVIYSSSIPFEIKLPNNIELLLENEELEDFENSKKDIKNKKTISLNNFIKTLEDKI